MVDFVVDKSLDVLLSQLNRHAPNRSKASDGSIGDTAHAARTSKHNPEDTEDSSDGNDPDNQVDARDFTHDPANGADMNEMTEDIRVSRDRRVNLVIWNRRQFSSYSTDSRKAWEWGVYSGTNDHTKHAHVETNDKYNDDLTPWKVFIMADSLAITSTEWRLHHLLQLHETGNNPANKLNETYPAVSLLRRVDTQVATNGETLAALIRLVNGLVREIDTLRVMVQDLQDRPAVVAAPVDSAVLQPAVEAGVRAVLRDGVS